MINRDNICIAFFCLGTVSAAVAEEDVSCTTEAYCVMAHEGAEETQPKSRNYPGSAIRLTASQIAAVKAATQ